MCFRLRRCLHARRPSWVIQSPQRQLHIQTVHICVDQELLIWIGRHLPIVFFKCSWKENADWNTVSSMLQVIPTQGQAMTTRESWRSCPMSWMRWVGGSGPPLQTLVVLWRGGKLWQAGASYLNGIRPTGTVSSLNTLTATSCSSLKPSSAWEVVDFWGCRLFWGV